jgi:hypothetical protein
MSPVRLLRGLGEGSTSVRASDDTHRA